MLTFLLYLPWSFQHTLKHAKTQSMKNPVKTQFHGTFFGFLPGIISIVFTFIVVLSTLAAQASMTPDNDSLEMERLTEKVRAYFRNRDFNNARMTVDSIHALAVSTGNTVKVGDSYFNHGLIDRALGNTENFREHMRQAVSYYRKAKEWDKAARSYTAIAQSFLNEKDYASAEANYIESLKMREQLKDSLGMANNLMNLGGTNYYGGRLMESTEYFYQALRMANAIGNTDLTALALMNISNIHTRNNNHEKAIEYLLQALAFRRAGGNLKSESDILLNLGIVYYEMGEPSKAEDHYWQSLAIKEELGDDQPGMIKLYNNLGIISRLRGDDETAMTYYSSALELARQINDRQTEAVALSNLGALLLANDDTSAVAFLQESLELARDLDLKKLLLSIYDNLQQYYSKFGDYEQAYHYALHHQSLNDSIFNEESAAKIIEMQTQYDTEIKEKENEILRNQASILQLRILILIISVISIIIIAASLIVMMGLKRKALNQNLRLLEKENQLNRLEIEKQEQETKHLQEVIFAEEQINKLQKRQLDDKNRELSTLTLQIINKNEALNGIRQTAINALKDDECDGKECIRQLIREVDTNIDLDNQWDAFKKHFESVHTGFFARLLERFPAITQNELKLCAYLRMNLSSKEIAQMLNITIESATTKRYRLRKKLQLANDDNLVSFLSEF